MKKNTKRYLSLLLAFTMLLPVFSVSMQVSAEGDNEKTFSQKLESGWESFREKVEISLLTNVVDPALSSIFTSVTNRVNKALIKNYGDGAFTPADEYVSENFYEGSENFLTQAQDGAQWKLGSASASLVPEDYDNGSYYLGGYISLVNGLSNVIEGLIDDMRVRVTAISDGRGINVFAVIDSIGVSNLDKRLIGKQFSEMLAEKYPDEKIVSINVSATHSHSGIDTQGLWTGGIFSVAKKLIGMCCPIFGCLINDTDGTGRSTQYMDFVTDTTADAMLRAYEDMVPGTLTFARLDFNDRTDVANYLSEKDRVSAKAVLTDLNRLLFTPDDSSKRPTIIVNMGAHPHNAGMPIKDDGKITNSGREISGEYIYYMGEIINDAGYNFMFINGSIANVYIGGYVDGEDCDFAKDYAASKGHVIEEGDERRYKRSMFYGYELGRMTLSLTKTVEQIEADPLLGGGEWYEDWQPVEEVTVEPFLNIRLKEIRIPVTNKLIEVAGRTNILNYNVVAENDGSYSAVTEIGYVEFGNAFKAVMVPGELVTDIITGGGSTTAAGSYSGTDFGYPSIWELFGEGTQVFGITNDAIGYIVPDNDFTYDHFTTTHYNEMLSLGYLTASTIVKGFVEIKADITQ